MVTNWIENKLTRSGPSVNRNVNKAHAGPRREPAVKRKRAALPREGLPACSVGVGSAAAAGPGGSAAGATAAGTEIHGAVDFESVLVKIDLDGLHLLHEAFVDHVGESFDFEHVVSVFRLIQSHGQRGAASASLVEKNPDGRNVFAFEVFGDLLCRRRGYFDHENLLEKLVCIASGCDARKIATSVRFVN
jgi:hypothetical protein